MKLLHINTAAKRLKCTRKNVYYLVSAGRIKETRLSARGMRISEYELNEYIEKKRIKNIRSRAKHLLRNKLIRHKVLETMISNTLNTERGE